MLQACLNGNRTKHEHAAVPYTPFELAADAALVVRAGAHELHLHPRADDGTESLRSVEVAATLRAVRAQVPGVLVGISTHAGIPSPTPLAALLATWTELPDYVSINLGEAAAPDLWHAAACRGIAVEAGLSSVADAQRLLQVVPPATCCRLLVEIAEQTLEEALHTAHAILRTMRAFQPQVPRLLHGTDATMWPLFQVALEQHLSVRIGLEDGLQLPSGALATGNEQLLQQAAAQLSAQRREAPLRPVVQPFNQGH
ncbi:3-keto-5-aminohexanoate cleavage protein [Hymenobacter glacieicola]|uniref:3-keto-5-aminohexanoate cleavage enzyme n=1 Tax=Hymenobacter glacieicola TaxID=1562124 RepID=A0ABQ1X7Y6_9BACT|nr:3-keto-5-aminohexanoate cleavage protein [Hymenobacter glacieicola]GGG60343.1 3-keto-5-aminohexanoate cleavage enzyme [Hymenobacter glacieicola]